MKPIRIGQIGVGHEHASGIMAALRRLSDWYEVVGYAEEDEPRWHSPKVYEGLERMTQQQLLDTPGLQAVAVETNMPELAATALRCMERGLHMHLDKPGGEALEPFGRGGGRGDRRLQPLHLRHRGGEGLLLGEGGWV